MSAYEPDWVAEGVYAEYNVEEYLATSLAEKGTYVWRIVSIHAGYNGKVIARINETYDLEWKTDGWYSFWATEIQPTGRIWDIDIKNGIINSRPLWFNRYFNRYLLDLSDFKIGNETFDGECLEEISVQGEVFTSIRLTRQLPTYYRVDAYWFDKDTGLLLKYAHGFRDRATQMILKSTNISSKITGSEALTDLLLLFPLFIVPIAGAFTGLIIIDKRRYKIDQKSWFLFIFFNGIVLAFVANWPFRIPLGRLSLGIFYTPTIIYKIAVNASLWMGTLALAIFFIDRFAFPIIQHSNKN